MNILTINVESNGLWGTPIAIGAIVYNENAEEVDKVLYRLPDKYVTNKWVKDIVLPILNKIDVTHDSYEDMLKDFSKFYLKHLNTNDCKVLYHMGHIVESYLFRQLHDLGYIGDFEAPYLPIELSETLRVNGYHAPDSVDKYIEEHDIQIEGETHDPLYDCRVNAKVYFDLNK